MSILTTIGAYLAVAGNEIANIDEKRTGADGLSAAILLYAAGLAEYSSNELDTQDRLFEMPEENYLVKVKLTEDRRKTISYR